MTAVLIVAIVALIAIAIILAFVIYNQMLLLNQVNKRLLLMTKESIENERLTMEELQQRLDDFEQEHPTTKAVNAEVHLGEDDEPFDPHTFDPTNLE